MQQRRQHGLILLVEDNPDDMLLTRRVFERNDPGNRVITRRDGQEALDDLLGADDGSQAGGPLPDVMLRDLKLPRVDGLQVLRRMHAEDRTRYLPVVVLTTSDEQRDILDSYRMGANCYIRKPVDTREFFSAIQSVERYWTARGVTPPVVQCAMRRVR